MSSTLQPVRGTHDVLPEEMRKHRKIIDTARKTALLSGYEEMATPIFEKTEVFARTLGDTSDIVTKEMYTFQDRGGESLTLRPEGTAGVARALISEGLQQHLPLKYFYSGPMFRYERPQKGRLRQFHQTGIEYLGEPAPWADADVIATGVQFLMKLGVADKCVLEINSLGDKESRNAYRAALVAYLEKRKDGLSKESQERLVRNPLRILDSKSEGDQDILKDAPHYPDYLTDSALDFYNSVQWHIGARAGLMKIRQNPRLVRGLDYYCHTCFEITCEELGAQKTVLAGGRYDGLVRTMGGPDVPGIGWASGVERLALLIGPAAKIKKIAIVPLDLDNEAVMVQSSILWSECTAKDIPVEFIPHRKFQKALAKANKMNAAWTIIIGEDEVKSEKFSLLNMESGHQELLSKSEIFKKLENCRLR